MEPKRCLIKGRVEYPNLLHIIKKYILEKLENRIFDSFDQDHCSRSLFEISIPKYPCLLLLREQSQQTEEESANGIISNVRRNY
jgi:hypothetical protein